MKKSVLMLVSLAVLMAGGAGAQPVEFEEGTHYEKLQIPVNTRAENKIVVTEYFSYGCPHCYRFDPMITQWKNQLPDYVEFRRTPAVWNKDYQVYAQSYYAAEALNVLKKVHTPLFEEIHVHGSRLNDPKRMAVFFSEFGVDPVDFAKVYSSFGVRASVQQAEARGRAYRASGVPAIIVNGKYLIEGKMAGNNANMLKIADVLIEKERQAMNAE